MPQAGSGQIRVRVTAAGLNPMDWFMTSDAQTAARFGLSLPCGFGTDYAGVVDQVGDGVSEFVVGERVFGGALSRAVADYVVVGVAGTIAVGGEAHRTPDGVDDRTAATLAIAGRTAAAALAVVNSGPGDTVLIGGAGGGVGVFAVQLARLGGARVIGTGSATSADALRALGTEPVAHGDGLVGRVRALAPAGVTAVMDLHGTDTAQAARELGVPDERITTVAAQVDGITPANGANAAQHWIHLRTTNPIESTFATVRHRIKVTKGPGSSAAGLASGLQAHRSRAGSLACGERAAPRRFGPSGCPVCRRPAGRTPRRPVSTVSRVNDLDPQVLTIARFCEAPPVSRSCRRMSRRAIRPEWVISSGPREVVPLDSRLVRPANVVMLLELPQRLAQMAFVPDQGPVQQFTPARLNPALRDRVHPRHPDARAHDLDAGIAQDLVELDGILPIAVTNRLNRVDGILGRRKADRRAH